jgi:hypothetical protein
MKLAVCLALLLPSIALGGGLTWDQTEVAIESLEGAGKVPGEFRFTNNSAQPIRLRAVAPSCGCIVAKPDKRDYAPGESAVIPFTYAPKGKWGTRAYRIFVVTDEPGNPYEIRLVVTETRR